MELTPEVWQRVDLILNQALDLPPAERHSYIDVQCQKEPSLLAQVKTLLLAYDESQDLFEAPALVPDQKLGTYRIVREIGRGGMGIVYLGERDDDQFEMRVAIKVVASTMSSGELVRRFREERRILARLQHPNVARLIDAGAHSSGLRYIVMEYVDGVSLQQYSRDRQVGEKERLKLFQQVCAAVQMAHRNLIVHRDIKPGNILVTKDGVPKLLDFGIAKILDPSEGAREATVVRAMTPDYASPEQLAGRAVTTATDIFSLGVLLSKLLEDKANIDLAAIVAKATRKQPEERYASADELSADIDRYLSGLPVLARSRSSVYIVKKFVRRHPAGVAAAMFAVVLGAAGIIEIVHQSRVAQRETAKAQMRFDQVRKLARSVMYELHDSIAALPGLTSVRALLVKRSLEYLDPLAKEGEDDDGLQQELADAYQRVGSVQGQVGSANLGDTAGALESYRKSRAILERLVSRKPHDVRLLADLAHDLRGISGLQALTGKKAEGLATAREALRLGEVAYRQDPNDSFARFARAAGYFEVALKVEGYEEQHAAWVEALNAYEAELARKPSDENAMRNVALVHKYLVTAATKSQKRNWPEALRHGELARDLDLRRLGLNPSNHQAKLDLTFDYSQIAFVLFETGDIRTALQNYEKIEAIREELGRADPQDANLRQRLGFAKSNIGVALLELHQPGAAAVKFREALAIAEALYKRDDKDSASMRLIGLSREGIGRAESMTNEHEASCADYREAHRAFNLVKAQLQESDMDSVRNAARAVASCPGHTGFAESSQSGIPPR